MPEERDFEELVDQLINEEKEIKVVHKIIQLIQEIDNELNKWFFFDINLKDQKDDKWENISEILIGLGYPSDKCTPEKCQKYFDKWTQFYAKNYDKLNGNLENNLQEMFDLLKIIHILDLNKVFESQNLILSLLKDIEIKNEIKEYVIKWEIKKISEEKGIKFLSNLKKNNWNEIEITFMSKKDEKNNTKFENDFQKVFYSFEDMNLHKSLLMGIKAYGLEKPSFIQQRAIVPCIMGRDIIAQAQSGMGKTAAFVIAVLQMIETSLNECQALILAPTRELAQQIGKVVFDLGRNMNVTYRVFIGGTDICEDINHLQSAQGVHIVIGTIGRVIKLIKQKELFLHYLKVLVLDEPDKLLPLNNWSLDQDSSYEFVNPIIEIIKILNPRTQLFFSSATMTDKLMKISETLMRSPLKILVNNEELTLEGIKQFYVFLEKEKFKFDTICDLYKTLSKTQTFIYCNSCEKVDRLIHQLSLRKISVAAIHGTMKQRQRENILNNFRCGSYRVLITSDLLERGIDVQQVSYVVNYDLPTNLQTYIHRIGRSGRFGRKGIAISFVTSNEMKTIEKLKENYNTDIEELPSNF